MANHMGSEGTVHIGTDAVAEIKSYSVSESMNTIEDTTINDTSKTFQTGTKEWDGSVDVFWDETDTAQSALTIGASVILKFYPEGATTGDTFYSGTALVTGVSRSAATDGLVEASYSLKGTGALATATV
tara:strand:- start:270 stop:656 length:387 start_codon:yes stop_codon:yes gene_type:complete